jgi:hypothetical protein
MRLSYIGCLGYGNKIAKRADDGLDGEGADRARAVHFTNRENSAAEVFYTVCMHHKR